MAGTPKATEILTKAATQYATAKAGDMIGKIGDRAAGNGGGASKSAENDGDNGDGGEEKKGFLGNAAEKLGEGASPVGAAVKGAGLHDQGEGHRPVQAQGRLQASDQHRRGLLRRCHHPTLRSRRGPSSRSSPPS